MARVSVLPSPTACKQAAKVAAEGSRKEVTAMQRSSTTCNCVVSAMGGKYLLCRRCTARSFFLGLSDNEGKLVLMEREGKSRKGECSFPSI